MTVSHYLFLAFECSSLLGLQLNAYQESGRKTLPKDIYMPALWLISSPVLARNFAMRQAHFVFFCLASKNAIPLQFKRLIDSIISPWYQHKNTTTKLSSDYMSSFHFLYFEDISLFVFKYDFQLLEKTTTQAFAKLGLGHGYWSLPNLMNCKPSHYSY